MLWFEKDAFYKRTVMVFFCVTYNEVRNILTKQGLPRKLHQRESAKSVARNFVSELIDFKF